MDGLKVVPRKTPDQIPFWLDPKYDRYDFAYLFLHGLRYDRYDLRFFRYFQSGGEEKWMDPTARKIWEAMISDEADLPSPKRPTWPGWVERLFWLGVGRLRSEGADKVRSWLEENVDEVGAWLEELLTVMATAVSSLM